MNALEDHFTKKLADGAIKAAKQIFMVVVIFIFASAATATDPYFRKKLGERYFTPSRMFMSLMGWLIIAGIPEYLYQSQNQKVPTKYLVIGTITFWSYLTLSVIRLRDIRKRRFAGEVWHSKSRGESVFGSENALRDSVIEIVVTGVLCFFSYYCAAFFALSRILGYLADAAARAEFYNRYLDIQDAKIEAEYMETALREGLAPDHTLGIFNPLPKGFKGQHRANIARIVTAGQFGTATADEAPLAPKPAPATPQAPSAAFETAKKIGGQVFRSTLGSKRFLAFCAFVLIAFGIVKCGIFLFHAGHSKWNQHVAARLASTATAPADPVSQPRPAPVAVAATTSAQEAPVAVPQTAAPAVDIGPATHTDSQTATLKQRQQAIAETNALLTNRIAQLAQFTADCEARIAANDAKLPGFVGSDREILTHNHNSARKAVETDLKTEAEALNGFQIVLGAYASKPESDPQSTIERVTNYFAKMDKNRGELTGILASDDKDFAFHPH